MGRALVIISSVAIVVLGALILFDYRKFTSAWRSRTIEWWSAGPLRRKFNVKVPSFRFMGALLIFMGVVVFVSQLLPSG